MVWRSINSNETHFDNCEQEWKIKQDFELHKLTDAFEQKFQEK